MSGSDDQGHCGRILAVCGRDHHEAFPGPGVRWKEAWQYPFEPAFEGGGHACA